MSPMSRPFLTFTHVSTLTVLLLSALPSANVWATFRSVEMLVRWCKVSGLMLSGSP